MNYYKTLQMAVFMHVFYIAIALIIVILLWKILPGASHAKFRFKKWEFGGALAGFGIILLILLHTGPANYLIHLSHAVLFSN